MVRRQPLTIANRASRRRAHLLRAPENARSKHLFMARAALWTCCLGGAEPKQNTANTANQPRRQWQGARPQPGGMLGRANAFGSLTRTGRQNESARPRRAGRPAAIEAPMQGRQPRPNALIRRSGPFFRISAQVSNFRARAQASSRRSGIFLPRASRAQTARRLGSLKRLSLGRHHNKQH